MMVNTDICNPLAFTAALNALAVAIAAGLDDSQLSLAAVVLTQLGDTLAIIAAQRTYCGRNIS